MHPELEIHSTLAATVFSGEGGLRRWMAEVDEQFEAWDLEITGVDEAGPDRFVVDGSINARGRGSGMSLVQPASWIVEFDGGRLKRMDNFIGPGAAETARERLA